MSNFVKVRDHEEYVRDPKTNAILNIDNAALSKYKQEREQRLRIARVLENHDQMVAEIDALKSSVQDIKILMQQMLQLAQEKA